MTAPVEPEIGPARNGTDLRLDLVIRELRRIGDLLEQRAAKPEPPPAPTRKKRTT